MIRRAAHIPIAPERHENTTEQTSLEFNGPCLTVRPEQAVRENNALRSHQRTERKTDRPANEPSTHFDPKSGRRIDAREKPEQGGLLGVRIESRR